MVASLVCFVAEEDLVCRMDSLLLELDGPALGTAVGCFEALVVEVVEERAFPSARCVIDAGQAVTILATHPVFSSALPSSFWPA